MAATRQDIEQWFVEAPGGSTHMIVATDEMDWSDFPVYVGAGEDARQRYEQENQKPLQRVMEVYRLDYSFEKQWVQRRCKVFELPPDGHEDKVLAACRAIDEGRLERGELSKEEMIQICLAESGRRLDALERRAEARRLEAYAEGKRARNREIIAELDASVGSSPPAAPGSGLDEP